eukprot:COSAG04_NODE_15473_length_531_cov_0.708333_1_plen_95_part_10
MSTSDQRYAQGGHDLESQMDRSATGYSSKLPCSVHDTVRFDGTQKIVDGVSTEVSAKSSVVGTMIKAVVPGSRCVVVGATGQRGPQRTAANMGWA